MVFATSLGASFSLLLFLGSRCTSAYSCADFGCNGIANYINANCGVDPNANLSLDDSSLGVYGEMCPCQDVVMTAAVTWTGVDGGTSSGTASTLVSSSTVTAFVLPFAEINRNIMSGSPVTMVYTNNGLVYPALSYTYSPVTSLYYVEATSTVSVTVGTETTETDTATVTSTSIISQQTSYSDCTTGTQTVTLPDATSTITATITPKPRTITVPKVVCTTTHLKCVPNKHIRVGSGLHLREESKARGLARRQYDVNAGTVEIDWCPEYLGAPVPTTYITGTEFDTATVTTTNTVTVALTKTDTETVTPTHLTTTVCNDVEASTTTQKTDTITRTTTLHRSTTRITKTYTLTETVYDRRHPPPCTKPPTRRPPPGSCSTINKPTAS
ncbi:hypothetical protein DL767_008498 [Monosporascus sp. MG133]|nr:hypothetical protein DL767_008498 [Monosporascus sp. MG133]